MTELPPNAFTYGNYGFHIPLGIYLGSNENFLAFMRAQIIIGYNKYPSWKVREDTYAVLFEEEDGEYWTHVPDYIMNKLLGKDEDER